MAIVADTLTRLRQSDKARKVHSITFITETYGNSPGFAAHPRTAIVSTYDDWHLIPESRPVIAFPSPKYKFLDIPGANSSLDMTNAGTGFVPFNQRTGSIKFMVENGFKRWEVLSSEIAAFLSGTKIYAVLADDPAYYYTGRWHVSSWDSPSNGTWSTITLDYTLDPYKLWVTSTAETYLWDSYAFDFTDSYRSRSHDQTANFASIELPEHDSAFTARFMADMMPTTPVFNVHIGENNDSDHIIMDMYQESLGIRYENIKLYEGTSRIEECVLYRAQTEIDLVGCGTVSIDYRGGRL